MMKHLAKQVLKPLNAALHVVGAEMIRHRPRSFQQYGDYLPFASTVEAARASGLSLGDYIDREHNYPGSTQETIDRLKAIGALHPGIRRVCEIGPGSGRYLERVIAACKPERYEVYETAVEWRHYLAENYLVVAHPTDGRSLAHTGRSSVDLVHAQKVFVGLPFRVLYGYFAEMARVTAPGGKVVFDVVTEACMDDDTAAKWLGVDTAYHSFPALVPRQYVINFFERRGFSADGSFLATLRPGQTECLVFTRR
jgi:hypothetical protein